ncbi:hypothetical protein CUJ87_32015 (plasmid) [Paraburkholderia caledonica]|nr:hypothetical protein CUJ87_32015 [Paraburkholderia caledonica]
MFPVQPDQHTILFTRAYCLGHRHLGPFYLSLILFGSRARGQSHREYPDHDFVCIVADSAADEIQTGRELWLPMFEELDRRRKIAALGAVDLLVRKKSGWDAVVPNSASEVLIERAKADGMQVA